MSSALFSAASGAGFAHNSGEGSSHGPVTCPSWVSFGKQPGHHRPALLPHPLTHSGHATLTAAGSTQGSALRQGPTHSPGSAGADMGGVKFSPHVSSALGGLGVSPSRPPNPASRLLPLWVGRGGSSGHILLPEARRPQLCLELRALAGSCPGGSPLPS